MSFVETPEQMAQRENLQGMFGLTGAPPAPIQQPFLWGAGGKRLTPEELARGRAMADQQAAIGMDFSPVGHWTQGAARLANAIGGKVQGDRLDKMAEQNRAESQSVAEALLGGDVQPDAVLGALTNPYVDPQVRELAQMQWKRMNPEPEKDPEIVRLSQIANDPARPAYERQAAAERISAINDPLIAATLPGNRFYSGPQSQLATILGGGDPASSGPQPGTVEDGYRFRGGDPADQSNWEPVSGGQGMPAMTVTPRELDALVNRFGPASVQARIDSGQLTVRTN